MVASGSAGNAEGSGREVDERIGTLGDSGKATRRASLVLGHVCVVSQPGCVKAGVLGVGVGVATDDVSMQQQGRVAQLAMAMAMAVMALAGGRFDAMRACSAGAKSGT